MLRGLSPFRLQRAAAAARRRHVPGRQASCRRQWGRMAPLLLAVGLLVALMAGCQGGPPPGRLAPPPEQSTGDEGSRLPVSPEPPESVENPEPEPAPVPGPFDLVILGATVYDGTGRAPYEADVGIVGDRIAAVGSLEGATAGRRVEARGLALAPGFIDVHAHTYEYDDADGVAAAMQGITTQFGGVDGRHDGFLWYGERPGDFVKALDWVEVHPTAVNQGLFVGLETLRKQVAPGWGAVGAAEMAQMQELLKGAMAAGAIGLSTGLEYENGGLYATTDQIVEVARAMAPAGGVYATHVRHERSDLLTGVREALEIGRRAGVPVAIDHFKFMGPDQWDQFDAVMQELDAAHSSGLAMTVNVYAYRTPSYGMHLELADAWAQVGRRPDRAHLIILEGPADWQGRDWRGLSLTAAAEALAVTPQEAVQQLAPLGAKATVEWIRLDHQAAILKRPYALTSSDGEARAILPAEEALQAGLGVHPRSYGNYALFLRLNREDGWLPMETLIHQMTGAAADFYGLKDRGYVREGAYADLVLFDPARVREGATWWEPQEYPEGIEYVLVNGELVVEGGSPTAARPGRALRREPSR